MLGSATPPPPVDTEPAPRCCPISANASSNCCCSSASCLACGERGTVGWLQIAGAVWLATESGGSLVGCRERGLSGWLQGMTTRSREGYDTRANDLKDLPRHRTSTRQAHDKLTCAARARRSRSASLTARSASRVACAAQVLCGSCASCGLCVL